jgi:hypothetical protein
MIALLGIACARVLLIHLKPVPVAISKFWTTVSRVLTVRKHPGKFVGALPGIQKFTFRIECRAQDKCFSIHLGANFGLKVLYRGKPSVHFVVPPQKLQEGLGFPKLRPSAVVRWHHPTNLNIFQSYKFFKDYRTCHSQSKAKTKNFIFDSFNET